MNTIKKNVISFVLVMALVLTSVTVMPVSGATNVTTISNLKFAKMMTVHVQLHGTN